MAERSGKGANVNISFVSLSLPDTHNTPGREKKEEASVKVALVVDHPHNEKMVVKDLANVVSTSI